MNFYLILIFGLSINTKSTAQSETSYLKEHNNLTEKQPFRKYWEINQVQKVNNETRFKRVINNSSPENKIKSGTAKQGDSSCLYLIDSIISNSAIISGQFLISHNRRYKLVMQSDGNLVIYNTDYYIVPTAVWSSKTNNIGESPYNLSIQNDGNLVIYDKNGKAIWNTKTGGRGNSPYKLIMQSDGNLVIYDLTNTARWSSWHGIIG